MGGKDIRLGIILSGMPVTVYAVHVSLGKIPFLGIISLSGYERIVALFLFSFSSERRNRKKSREKGLSGKRRDSIQRSKNTRISVISKERSHFPRQAIQYLIYN